MRVNLAACVNGLPGLPRPGKVAFLVRSIDPVEGSIGELDATDHRAVFGVERFDGVRAF